MILVWREHVIAICLKIHVYITHACLLDNTHAQLIQIYPGTNLSLYIRTITIIAGRSLTVVTTLTRALSIILTHDSLQTQPHVLYRRHKQERFLWNQKNSTKSFTIHLVCVYRFFSYQILMNINGSSITHTLLRWGENASWGHGACRSCPWLYRPLINFACLCV